jgi:hypothetical protein
MGIGVSVGNKSLRLQVCLAGGKPGSPTSPPPFFFFFWSEAKSVTSRKIPLHTPTLGVWFHQATQPLPPLMRSAPKAYCSLTLEQCQSRLKREAEGNERIRAHQRGLELSGCSLAAPSLEHAARTLSPAPPARARFHKISEPGLSRTGQC